MNYRKLSNEELKALYFNLGGHFDTHASTKHDEIRQHIKRYYAADAAFAILTINSEYNDNTYDNTAGYLAVYNVNKQEILPTADTAKESRAAWKNFEVDGTRGNGTVEPMEDIVIYVNPQPLPTIYIKE